jgi:hypothetical protein
MPNRLGLARWLVDRENPLTARVTVNRFWEQVFGRGIVETSEDFGTQGERPTHPELLDWLALEFMEPTWEAEKRRPAPWSMKAFLRLLVTSATYRQSSRVTPALLEKDPYNRWHARGPRFRMEAEMLRDAALASSGLLSRTIGGPSVFPHQPEGIWFLLYGSDHWVMSGGEDRWRRGLYTFWRRTAPYPGFLTFDAPDRNACVIRRIRTNTPLQALNLMNDVVMLEAARALARRLAAEAGPDPRARVERGFRLCLSRRPVPAETEEVLALVGKARERYGADPEAAVKLATGETPLPAGADAADLAAWTMASSLLLNLDEAMTKE